MLAIMMSLGVGASSFTFWSILLPMVAFAIWMTTKYVAISDSLKQSISSERKVSSNYLQVVDMARRMRMAIVPNAQSVAEISEAIKRVANQKEELDAKFFPATKDLNENRKKVRVRVLDDLDPMDVLDAVESERFRPENIKKSA
jgi:E3 ubiquitin-protein ligase DOA10